MKGLVEFLNIASACASIMGFIVAIYSFPAHKRRAALYFFAFVVFALVFLLNLSTDPSSSKSSSSGETAVERKSQVTEVSKEPRPDTPAPATPKEEIEHNTQPQFTLRVHSIRGMLYSYSNNQWGGELFGGGSYPNISLQFASGLVVDPSSVTWQGSYQFENNEVCLTITGLNVPQRAAQLADFFRDVGVGYGVELDNAVFGDYTMSRVIMLYRTFSGDSPAATIRKCFPVIPVPTTEHAASDIHGEWRGAFTEAGSDAGMMIVRLLQKGNKIFGSILETAAHENQAEKSRWEVEGWILDNRLTFIKRNGKRSLVAISYVGPCSPQSKELSGTWYAGLGKGHWSLKYSGEFNDSDADILNPAAANPPDK